MKFDVILVLSGGIKSDGTLLPTTLDRLDKAAELFNKKLASAIIVSGKYGFRKGAPVITEAKAMSDYLQKLSIPKKSILLEEESKDTIGNAYFVKSKFLKPRNWKSIALVTSDFHLEKTKHIFNKIFGSGYKISFFESHTPISDAGMKRIKSRQEKTMHIFKKWTLEIADGDDESIGKLINEKHPAYVKNPIRKIIAYIRLI